MPFKRVLSDTEAQEKFKQLQEKGLILFECIVGSTSYGLAVEGSDIDKKFVFINDLDSILSGDVLEQLNVTKDYVGYEISFFTKLICNQNPNISELLFSDPQFHTICNPIFKKYYIDCKDKFITKEITKTYSNYAFSQIKKAQTTNKKFLKDLSGPRKQLIDFSFVNYALKPSLLLRVLGVKNKKHSTSLKRVLELEGLNINDLAISPIKHMKDYYNVFKISDGKKHGIFGVNGVDLKIGTIPIDAKHLFEAYINTDGFSIYCKEYAEWHQWNENKNPIRFTENLENEKKYDRKNMMHCHRLLNVCYEAICGKGINVLRKNDREYLLGIRYGEATYEELVETANFKRNLIEEAKESSTLPENLDESFIENILKEIRKELYF